MRLQRFGAATVTLGVLIIEALLIVFSGLMVGFDDFLSTVSGVLVLGVLLILVVRRWWVYLLASVVLLLYGLILILLLLLGLFWPRSYEASASPLTLVFAGWTGIVGLLVAGFGCMSGLIAAREARGMADAEY
jgi:hypothetical protein